jgi:hypothetical protein
MLNHYFWVINIGELLLTLKVCIKNYYQRIILKSLNYWENIVVRTVYDIPENYCSRCTEKLM